MPHLIQAVDHRGMHLEDQEHPRDVFSLDGLVKTSSLAQPGRKDPAPRICGDIPAPHGRYSHPDG